MMRLEVAVSGALCILFALMVAVAFSYRADVRLVPVIVGGPSALLALVQLLRAIRTHEVAKTGNAAAAGESRSDIRAELAALLWVAAFILTVLAGGFVIGGTIAVVISQRFWLRESWKIAAVGGVVALFVSHVCFERALGLVLFSGWIAEALR